MPRYVGSTANPDAGVAANIRAFDTRNEAQLHTVRSKRLQVYQYLLGVLFIGYAIQTYAIGQWPIFLNQISCLPILAISWWFLHRRDNRRLASNIYLGLQLWSIGIGTVLSGGIASPTIWTFALVPVTASSLTNSRGTACWTAVSGVALIGIWILDKIGVKPAIPPIPTNESVFLCALMIIAFSMTAYMTSSESVQHLILINTQRNELANAHKKANEANRAKAKFLARMSHELRTPMNGLLGVTQHLLDEPMPERDLQAVDIVHRCAENLLTMLNDALDISKVDSSRVEISKRAVDIQRLLSDIHSLFLAKAKLDGIELVLDIQCDANWILTDPTRVRQIVSNLVGNALRYSDSGRVLVALKVDEKAPSQLCISVEDEGIGMDLSQISRLFQDFEQVHDDSDSDRGGTGLGLAISKRLAQMLDGDIRVTSERGQGSTFELLIPFIQQEPTGAFDVEKARHQRPTLLKGLKALVVDDSPINLKVATLALEKLGLECESAKDGQQALQCCKTNYYDAVFMDIRMPVMDGLAATRAIRAQESVGRRIPIIALTANAYKEDEQSALAAGMDAYVSKPFKLQDLERALYLVLHQTPTERIEDCRIEYSTILPRAA